jgi:carbonic anhydrase/acetyltransferase-like protein (isoleucine patch superfamily)
VHIADSEIGDSVRIGNQVTVHGARVGADSVIAANSVIGREK